MVPIPLKSKPLRRSEFRDLLREHGIVIQLDFDKEQILAGRVDNLILNWSDQPLTVKIPEAGPPLLLQPMEYRFLPSAGTKRGKESDRH